MNKIKKNMIEKANRRIWEIDFVRGVLIIGMVIDHLAFFMYFIPSLYPAGSLPGWTMNIADFSQAYWHNEFKIAVRYFGLALFFLLTGISSKFSKSNLKRSLVCTGFGVLLSLVYLTYTLISGNRHLALFSVITCLGVSMFLYWAGKALYAKIRKTDHNWKWWSLGIGGTLILGGFIMDLCLSTNLKFGTIFLSLFGEYNPGISDASETLTFSHAIQTIIGSYQWGNDCLGLLPYLGFTYLGGFIGEHLYAKKRSLFFRKNSERNVSFNAMAIRKTWVINWLGSKTFIIYVVHPVVIVLLLVSILSIIAGTLPF